MNILNEFCSHSTVHGVRYFTEPKRHWIERYEFLFSTKIYHLIDKFPYICAINSILLFRMWWTIAFLLSAALGAYLICNIWLKWDERPVIVSFNDKYTSISMIPFPAVTICSTKKFVEDKIDTELFWNILLGMGTNKSAYKTLSAEM